MRYATTPGMLSAALWDDAQAEHVQRAVLAAPLIEDPAPYLFVENVFSPAAYAAVVGLFPTDPAVFHRWRTSGDPAQFGNHGLRREVNLPDEADRLPPEQRAFWSALTASLCSARFAQMLLERFAASARSRFGALLDDPSFAAERLSSSLSINEHEPDYYLGPHTDRPERVFTALFYIPERAGLDHLGTSLYRPRQPGFSSKGERHYDPQLFERSATIPYRPNSAFVFARSDLLFHGVEPLTRDQLRGSRRRGINLQYWLSQQRRQVYAVNFEAVIPATMPAGTESALPFRLTNRSGSELASTWPNETQLGYRWLGANGSGDSERAGRTPLGAALPAGATRSGAMRVAVPRRPGRYLLRLSVVEEGVAWFDDVDPDNGVAGLVTVWDGDDRTPSSEIVARTAEIALGPCWYALERERGAAFRWVENDAVVHVAALHPVHHALCLLVEPGPGVAPEPLLLSARIEGADVLGTVALRSKELVRFALPPQRPAVFSVILHAERGGRPSPNDPRVLNFRVFEIFVERSADVFPAWATPKRGFYPLEVQDERAFRWVCGDATIAIDPARGDVLTFDVESGPGFASQPFVLSVAGPGGGEIVSAQVAARTSVAVPLRGLNGTAELTLRAPGGGRVAEDDPRTLNYRIFAAGD